jgi:DNA-binding PadR family transcriptional regulator
VVSQDHELPATSYALLGLLSFGQELSGYEVKQWAESTLRFYWVAPAMSQVYSELGRLAEHGLVDARDDAAPGRTVRRYRITDRGRERLRDWLLEPVDDFPVLKHPVALKLLLGHLTGAAAAQEMLARYGDALAQRRADLAEVRAELGDDATFAYPALVAEWGLAYYDSERDIVTRLMESLRSTPQ